ncbi:protein of unknown function [Candidatus Nitrosocosmicus franklandus]|uniref:Uncharacterized protein n=1 Tax=Candidatus Nitrosocosmicus franklandianus TaxID=1798806 RepID=A0A484IJT5_9ARCH|nr:protein of unknown function [Candidatus Nitrosocosmicus franklandus]
MLITAKSFSLLNFSLLPLLFSIFDSVKNLNFHSLAYYFYANIKTPRVLSYKFYSRFRFTMGNSSLVSSDSSINRDPNCMNNFSIHYYN